METSVVGFLFESLLLGFRVKSDAIIGEQSCASGSRKQLQGVIGKDLRRGCYENSID